MLLTILSQLNDTVKVVLRNLRRVYILEIGLKKREFFRHVRIIASFITLVLWLLIGDCILGRVGFFMVVPLIGRCLW